MHKNKSYRTFFLINAMLLGLLVTSCSGTKHLNEGEVLYKGAEIEFTAPDSIKFNNNKLKNKLTKKLVPKPNKKLLGLFRTRVWLYTKVKPKKSKGFKNWLKNKVGKEPVLVQDLSLEQKERVLTKTMQDNGYFYSKVTSRVIEKEKKPVGTVIFTVENAAPSKVVEFSLPDSAQQDLDSLFKSYNKYEVKQGQIYNLENIQSDRIGLANFIRSHGFYDFDKNDLYYVVDTSKIRSNKQLKLKLAVQPPEDSTYHRKFHIRDINIYPAFNERDTSKYAIDSVKNYYFKNQNNYKFIKNEIVAGNVFIEPDSIFSIQDYQLTNSRLVNLGIYKYVNINYKKTGLDSLDVAIRLTPTKYQHFKSSVELSTSTLGFLGNEVSVSYRNQNTGSKAIGLTVKAGAGTEFQFSNKQAELNVLDVNFGLTISIPRRLRFREEKLKSKTKPTTAFSITENFQKWIQYYTINDLNVGVTYTWGNPSFKKQKQPFITHELKPFNLSWLYLINTTGTFDDLISNNSQLKASFENNFIVGAKYSITINTQTSDEQRNHFYFNNSIETSGNIAYLFGKAIKPKQTEEFQILGIPFSQFVQLNVDARNYWEINKRSRFISRINMGIGLTYGNRETLPYSRQFFVGGPNTIRAFGIRSIGPGSYISTTDDNNAVEQTGDFKILMNLEYRWTVYKFIRGAVFMDAGNVWLLREDEARPGGEFKISEFYKQFGIGTGIGVRLDFSFIAIRLDLGMPLYKPYAEEGQRWINQYEYDNFKDWRGDNWLINFAIGYPF